MVEQPCELNYVEARILALKLFELVEVNDFFMKS